jgi:adenylate cyclase
LRDALGKIQRMFGKRKMMPPANEGHPHAEEIWRTYMTTGQMPDFAGKEYVRAAVEAGEEILRAMGNGSPSGPWLPVGVGVHHGVAFVGAITSEGGAADITVLGDTANVAARLTSLAAAGEMLISEEARQAAGLNLDGVEMRKMELKGRTDPLDVWIRKV